MSDLREHYKRRSSALRHARARLRSILKEAIATIEDKTLVRAQVSNVRIKTLSSLERKAKENGWNASEALTQCGDLVGGRVICNNIEDVYRFAELLKERLPILEGLFEIQDHIKEPNAGGYRALHIDFKLDISEILGLDLVPCEVQIRSRLQDAWAELSHDDMYKQAGLPVDLRDRAKDLAELLAAADKTASAIRLRVTREIAPPRHPPDLSRVSAEGLSYVFGEVFGRSPADYAIRSALDLCGKLGVTSLDSLPEVLRRTEFRDNVSNTYRSMIGYPIGVEDIFLAALLAVAEDDDTALRRVRWNARRELRELEQFAERHALSFLPDTIEQLIEDLEDPRGEEDEAKGWAEALGATSDCAICGTTVVQSFTFAEAAVQHYQLSGGEADIVHERIERALFSSGVDIGGWGDGSLCAYHNEQATKDD